MESLMWCIREIKIKLAVLFWSIAILFCAQQSTAQTFSVRSNDFVSVFYGLTIQPYGYQAIGRIIDSIDGEIEIPMIIINFDFNGEEIETNQIYFEERIFIPPRDNNARLNENTTVTAVIEQFEDNEINYSTIIWMNNAGDTLFTKRFGSPYYLEGVNNTNLNLPTAIICSPDGQYIYFVSQIFHSSSQNNFMIKKLTAQGEEVWTYVNPLNIWYAYCNSLTYFEGQPWFVAMASGNQGHFNKLLSLNDETGEVDFQVEHQGEEYPIGGSNDIVLDETGVVIATTNSSDGLLPHIYKMDFAGAYEWYSPAQEVPAPFQYNEHLVKSPDGGYVSCSVKYDEIPNPNAPNDPAMNNTSEKIWLWKVNSEGEFQWQRFYEYLSFDSGYFYLENIAHDLKATPDGGYIMAGEATANCLEWPCLAGGPFSQQGWLLKVDGCGCLVPGCDENCFVDINESESDNPQQFFKVGPNPASNDFYVYLSKVDLTTQKLELACLDMHGKIIRSFPVRYGNTTFVIDVKSLPAGEYFLQLRNDVKVLQTERVMVVR